MNKSPQGTPIFKGKSNGRVRLSAMQAGKRMQGFIIVLLIGLLISSGCVATRSTESADTINMSIKDSDGDGVSDILDKCPDSPVGIKVDTYGCPLDSDGDGELDSKDPSPDIRADESPTFPWPPPTPSARMQLDDKYFVSSDDLHRVDVILSSALKASDYSDKAYFIAPHGFVLVTQIEQINDAGVPLQGVNRWSIQPASYAGKSFTDYIRALFISMPGHFRIIAFIVTDKSYSTSSPSPTRSEAMGWLDKGLTSLPSVIGEIKSRHVHCEALVYEFIKLPSNNAKMVKPSNISANAHLNGAHILSNIHRATNN